MARSPAQPQDLSDKDRERLKKYLHNNPKAFTVVTVPPSRKRKRASPNLHTETNLAQERLAVEYEIKPANNWESLRRYKKFTVGDESIAAGEHILVKHEDTGDQEGDIVDYAAQWKAKVLEVRALDSENVFVRVAWHNRPEDLESGRKAYHGKNELIPTNQLDIIDAMSVNGKLDVYDWEEENDDSPMPDPQEYFWRQTLDSANTNTFSKLRLMCRDQTPQNPDEVIIQCGNAKCRSWLHAKCIAEDALERAIEAQAPVGKKRKSAGSTQKNGGPRQPKMSPSATAMAASKDGSLMAEFFIADLPADRPADKTEIVITDAAGETRSEEMKCLLCSETLD